MSLIYVAMSGGVDSSVAASVLADEGHDVAGVTMLLTGTCGSAAAVAAARDACETLGIEHELLDLREPFDERVVGAFADAYAEGRTPNPCVTCNDLLKFGALLDYARQRGADFLASGHHARVVRDAESVRLARATDAEKDQSYFLYRLGQERLEHLLFPVGSMSKTEVRRIARDRALPAASVRDSQDVCFTKEGEYEPVIERLRPDATRPGAIVSESGEKLGEHRGIGRYTVGQRKGLGIATGEPMYVVAIDAATNTVVAGPKSSLAVTHIDASRAVWYSDEVKQRCEVQTRSRGESIPGSVRHIADRLEVDLDHPVEGVACGQSVVCYKGDEVIGGGVIEGTR